MGPLIGEAIINCSVYVGTKKVLSTAINLLPLSPLFKFWRFFWQVNRGSKFLQLFQLLGISVASDDAVVAV